MERREDLLAAVVCDASLPYDKRMECGLNYLPYIDIVATQFKSLSAHSEGYTG